MRWQYLNQEEINGFDRYKYKSMDTSPVSNYITHPFWNFIVEYFPKWLAPNLMTFTGWGMLFMVYAVTSYYDPHLKAGLGPHTGYQVPGFWWMIFAAAQFIAHTLDGCDGKQARRTNSSSPLGELFDHGLDSMAIWLITLSLFCIFGHGSPSVTMLELYIMYFICLMGFFIAHWEKYNTGMLYLPWAYDSSQLMIALVYAVTCFTGVEFWKSGIPSVGISYMNVFRGTVYGSFITITLPMCIFNVYQAHVTNTCRSITPSEGMMPFLPIAAQFLLFTTWVLISPSNVLLNQPRLLLSAIGIVFSNITCRLIVSTMCGEPCERFNILLYPLAAILFVVPFLKAEGTEVTALVFYTFLVAVLHVHYGICVVNQLCDHLKIRCFSLKKP
ncbi:predicted protein [Nematostella vectensis]|uniref:Selenoprotein I n=1 Tax=Nematostella vectensis TaxID=45351 RepID=A7SXS5_NEMVE|nr:predicted protein [Nematostella vectensis]|eukprot:XP_001623573.1 predicted protein [Nematostella vectensis]